MFLFFFLLVALPLPAGATDSELITIIPDQPYFMTPSDIAFDSSGNIYVVDTNNHRIQKFDSSGTFITKWGSSGSSDGQFNYPQGITIDTSGNIYVVDTNNHRIQKLKNQAATINSLNKLVTTKSSINIIAQANTIKYYFQEDSRGNISGWTYDNRLSLNNLNCGTKYVFRVKGINFFHQETAWSNPLEVYTLPCSSVQTEPTFAMFVNSSSDFALKENYDDIGLYYDNQNGGLSVIIEQQGVVGSGYFSENVFIKDIYSTSPLTPWQNKVTLPQAIMAAASGVIGQYIYIAGGTSDWNDADYLRRYDTVNDVWENKATLPMPIVNPMTAVLNDKLYIIGGRDEDWGASASGVVYDPVNDSWSSIADMSQPRIGAVGGVYNNKIYVTGGIDGSGGTNIQTTAVYNPATDTWQEGLAPFPLLKSGGATAKFIGNKLYVAGGQVDRDGQFSDAIVAYDPIANTWETNLAPMPAKRIGGTSAVVNDKFLYIGGTDESWNSSNEIYLYDPATDIWYQIFDLPDFLHRSSVNIVNDQLFVMGGRNYGWDSVDTNFVIPVSNFSDTALNRYFKTISWSPVTPGSSSISLSYSVDGGQSYTSLGSESGTFYIDNVSSIMVSS